MQRFDSIIAGGGASGLSLAYHLGKAGLHNHRILLVDREVKVRNDRTWCFWEVGDGAFEPVVFRSWEHLWFHSETHSQRLAIGPYRYKMIQGLDFYQFLEQWLQTQPQITRLHGSVDRIEDQPDGVTVWVDGQAYHGNWAFNSVMRPQPQLPGYTYWLQHFKGWVIRTPAPAFEPAAPTFMDFRVPQEHDVRFVYVLPFDPYTALVEFTYFSPTLVPQEEYDRQLKHYISERLGLTSYAIEHCEFGVIPMSDAPLVRRPSPHVLNIGTAGGQTKASTGYTFQRIQRQSARIAASMALTGQPFYRERAWNRHAAMDSVLLKVLDTGRERGADFFSQLFSRNDPCHVLRFLDEETMLLEDVILMGTVNVPAFLATAIELLGIRLRDHFIDPLRRGDGPYPVPD
ncbi:lycopene cyclase [Candidatus Chloroploca sp. M-50]|uniref:Lycopene cyclase n=1 Tax=Candidatus Chloroploca mongolica TaxID=2528176 RepID=A0ABS4D4F8_9CHLR|nr:lycopene cyclase [Candidatus Chloroploca mongolica]